MSRFSQISRCVISSLETFVPVYDVPMVNQLLDWPYPNHFFSYFKRRAEKLVVMLHGSIDRSRMTLPVFQRWSWSEEIEASVLILSDPTLLDTELALGWWQGSEAQYALPDGGEFVKLVVGKLGYGVDDVLFFGSSAGGFAALMMAAYVRGGVALVNNPQTDLSRYYRERVQALLDCRFGGVAQAEILARYPTRVSVLEWFQSIGYIPRIVYYQNVRDAFHFENHYVPFVQGVYESGVDPNEFESVLYEHSSGHSPLERVKTVPIINARLAKMSAVEQGVPLREHLSVFESINKPLPF